MIAVDQLCLSQGRFAIRDISFEVPTGAYAVLMGKTGSGKTTVLEAICGLRRPTSGRIVLAGRDVTALPPAARGVGYVPQDKALFSTLTVRDHLAFALVIRRRPADEILQRVEQLAAWLQISHLLDRRPAGLSGGEAQRVALGRALSFRPAILCLDEPLSALDDDTREGIFEVLENIRRSEPVTVLHVTHAVREADRLADLVLRMEHGAIRTEARPRGGQPAPGGALN